jgi:uncharacterized protein (DUF58 family)
VLPKDLLAKVRLIEITTSRLVHNVFAGEYHSVFKGKGIEFDEVREYVPGDDVRDIDWNVTAKTGMPHTKKFTEEREMTVIFMVDMSASSSYGTRLRLKSEVIAEICALLAFAAIKNNDKVGILFFTDKVEKFIPPKKGKQHVLRVVREILSFKPKGKKTDLNVALRALNDIVRKSATVFLFSDFFCENYEKLLKVSHKKHDMVALVVEDISELRFPKVGMLNVEDAETGKLLTFNSNRRKFLRKFEEEARLRREARKRLFTSIRLDYIDIQSDKSYVEPLIRFFKERMHRGVYA